MRYIVPFTAAVALALPVAVAGFAAGRASLPPAPAPANCGQALAAVNALYEQGMRGQITLSPEAVRTLHAIERLACPGQQWAAVPNTH